MVVEKKALSSADLEAQCALELPDRHTLWCSSGPSYTVNVMSGNNFASFNHVDYDNAVNICAVFLNFNTGDQSNPVNCTIVQDVSVTPGVSVLPKW